MSLRFILNSFVSSLFFLKGNVLLCRIHRVFFFWVTCPLKCILILFCLLARVTSPRHSCCFGLSILVSSVCPCGSVVNELTNHTASSGREGLSTSRGGKGTVKPTMQFLPLAPPSAEAVMIQRALIRPEVASKQIQPRTASRARSENHRDSDLPESGRNVWNRVLQASQDKPSPRSCAVASSWST